MDKNVLNGSASFQNMIKMWSNRTNVAILSHIKPLTLIELWPVGNFNDNVILGKGNGARKHSPPPNNIKNFFKIQHLFHKPFLSH